MHVVEHASSDAPEVAGQDGMDNFLSDDAILELHNSGKWCTTIRQAPFQSRGTPSSRLSRFSAGMKAAPRLRRCDSAVLRLCEFS